jgi:hypothetical protein
MQTIIRAFDNEGKTWDRYTIVIDGAVYGMSCNADSPAGFNQYSGSIAECTAVLDVLSGKSDDNIGKEVMLTDLPSAVRKGIASRI